MKIQMKKTLSVLLSIVMLASVFAGMTFTASAASSGTCGANLTWTLYDDGLLVISGTGPMTNYSDSSPSPFTEKMDAIQTVVIEPGVTSIGAYAFNKCVYIASVSIPDGVKSIGAYAFCSCGGLTSVDLPDSVTEMNWCAFDTCIRLTSVDLPAGTEWIPDIAFHSCTSLTSVDLPSSVSMICSQAFRHCSLQNVMIPNGVTEIDSSSFEDCISLTAVVLPAGVTRIDYDAFNGSGLTTVYYLGSEAQWNGIEIRDGNEKLTGADIHYDCTVTGTTPATCTAQGSIALTDGSRNYSITTPAKGHNWVWAIDTKPCVNAGVKHEVCTRCGATRSANTAIPATGSHTYGDTGDARFTCTVCGHVDTDRQAAAAADDLIKAIGTVEYTAECKAKIDAARAAYDALTDAQKGLVTKRNDLTAAEAAYHEAELDANKVAYMAWNAGTGAFEERYVREYTEITEGFFSRSMTMSPGWYVVKENVTVDESVRAEGSGEIHLVLCDGATLAFSNQAYLVGQLSVYGQAAGTGRLTATITTNRRFSNTFYAGQLTVHGGTLEFITPGTFLNNGVSTPVTGISALRADNGITMYGGKLTAISPCKNNNGLNEVNSLAVYGGELYAQGGGSTRVIHGYSLKYDATLTLGEGMYAYCGSSEDDLADVIYPVNMQNPYGACLLIKAEAPQPGDKTPMVEAVNRANGVLALCETLYPSLYSSMNAALREKIDAVQPVLADKNATSGQIRAVLRPLIKAIDAEFRSAAYKLNPKKPVADGYYLMAPVAYNVSGSNSEYIDFSGEEPTYFGGLSTDQVVRFFFTYTNASNSTAVVSFVYGNGNRGYEMPVIGNLNADIFWAVHITGGDGTQEHPYTMELLSDALYSTDGLDVAMGDAALYYQTIKDGYPTVAAGLLAALEQARTDRYDPLADQNSLDEAAAELNAAVDAAKAAVTLADAKAAAKTELENYIAAIDPADYRPAQQTALTAAVDAGKGEIDAAADSDAVTAALNNAKTVIDAIKTDAQLTAEELAAAKATLSDAIGTAREYYESIKDDYPVIADDLDTKLQQAEGVLGNAAATIDEVQTMTELAGTALDAAKDARKAADMAAFEEYKESVKTLADSMKNEGDSDACIALIEAVKEAVDAVTYDEDKSLDENKDAVDNAAALTQLAADLAAQRAAEADDPKEVFEEYRATLLTLAQALRREGDSEAVTALIDEAVAALTDFTYDEDKTLAENEDALSEVLALFANRVKSQRRAERQAELNKQPCSLCGEHHTGSLLDNFIGVIHGIIWIMRSIVLIAA